MGEYFCCFHFLLNQFTNPCCTFSCCVVVLSCCCLQVRLTLFCIKANCATVALQGCFAIQFFKSLNPLHVPPHRVAFMRLVCLIEQALFREFRRIVGDNVVLYGSDFISTNSDFYTNKERRESFGCLVAYMLAQKYVFAVRSA
jgi:hypothetical protein